MTQKIALVFKHYDQKSTHLFHVNAQPRIKSEWRVFFDDVKNRSPDKLQELEQELEQKRQPIASFFCWIERQN